MFMTRMPLNQRRRATKALVASPHRLHAAVQSGFPGDSGNQSGEGRVLWRLDEGGVNPLLYVVSAAQPDFTHLVEEAGWPTTQTWESRGYDAFLDRLTRGQRWGFRLTANPVHKVRTSDSQTETKWTGHLTPAHQARWLLERAERMGVSFPDDDCGDPAVLVASQSVLTFPRQGQKVTLRRVVYTGVLEVTDAQALRHMLTAGVGRAKGYGCGLLTLAAPRSGE